MNIKQLRAIVALVIMAAALCAQAQDVSIERARSIASDFFNRHGVVSGTVAVQPAKMKAPARLGKNQAYYIFNNESADAFVVVSGDSRTPQVLAYSTDEAFDCGSVAPGAQCILDEYEEYIGMLQSGAAPVARVNMGLTQGKLINTALWNQSYNFWWAQTPMVGSQHTHAGCGATAMAIMMRHHNWPAKGYGNKTYTTRTLKRELSANFESIDYNFSDLPMGNESATGWTTARQNRMANILYQCGVATNMDYGTGGSSSYSTDNSVALYRYFGYNMQNSIAKSQVSEEQWYSYIINEIDAGYPMMYSGQSSQGGHMFICDGYDTDCNLHFNFGWSGSGNGYYNIVSAEMEYNSGNTILIGLRPAANAATRELADFHMRLNPESAEQGLSFVGESVIHRGQVFTLHINKVINTADADVDVTFALWLCGADGNRKSKIGERDAMQILKGQEYGWIGINGALPYDYTPAAGDRICLYSSADNGATWRKVTCYDPAHDGIDVASVYDSTVSHMKMVQISGKGLGLELAAGSEVNVKGTKFSIVANCLQNTLSDSFTGTVAAYVCTAGGTPKFMIGSSNINGLGSGYYYSAYTIPCAIPRGSDVEAGDRIAIFTKLSTESDYVPVVCVVPEKGSIEIAQADIDRLPTLLTMVTYNGTTPGMQLASGSINRSGVQFTLACNYARNNTSGNYTGKIGVFVCDADNRPLYQVDTQSYSISGLPANNFYTSPLNIRCVISSDLEIVPGDRLCFFAYSSVDDAWSIINCVEPANAYIDIPVYIMATTKTISFSNPYATFCPRCDLDLSSMGNIYAYRAVEALDRTIALERVYSVKAGEGVLLRGINANSEGIYTDEAYLEDDVISTGDNLFVGVLKQSFITQNDPGHINYVFGKFRDQVGFFLANGVTLTPGKAYLSVPNTQGMVSDSFVIGFSDDSTTGTISIGTDTYGDDRIYNMQGIEVTAPTKGIYIINGKKVIKR